MTQRMIWPGALGYFGRFACCFHAKLGPTLLLLGLLETEGMPCNFKGGHWNIFGFGCAGGIAEKLSEETKVSPFCSFSVHYPAQGGGIKIRQWPSVDQHSARDAGCGTVLKRPSIVAWRPACKLTFSI